MQAVLAAKNVEKPPAETSSTTKSKSKRKISESKECEVEAPITKKEQAKPKLMKDSHKGNGSVVVAMQLKDQDSGICSKCQTLSNVPRK